MTDLVLRPALSITMPSDYEEIPYAEIIEEIPSNIHFLESNTDSITLYDLTQSCIVPTYADQTLTIAHQDFVNTVQDAARDFFTGEIINLPEIRVSHEVKGRIPSALHKKPSELLESEKTRFFSATCFCIYDPFYYCNH